MEYPVIRAKDRAFVGTGIARKVRELGFIPAVVYGGEGESRNLVVDPVVVGDVLRAEGGRNQIVKVSIEGDKACEELAIIRDFQMHPVKRTILHCDFMRVTEDTPVVVKVPVKVVGKCEAEKIGAVVKVTMRNIRIKCPVGQVPQAIVVEADNLEMGDQFKISELPLPEVATPIFRRDNKVILVTMPKADKEEEEAAEAAEGAEGAEGAAAEASATEAPAAE